MTDIYLSFVSVMQLIGSKIALRWSLKAHWRIQISQASLNLCIF